MKISAGRLEVLIWALIYGGLLTLGLGIALVRGGADVGWSICIGAGAAALAGVVLVWVRSRWPEPVDR